MRGRVLGLGRVLSQDGPGGGGQQDDPGGGGHNRFGKLGHRRISLLRPVDLLPLLVKR
jgi:hypothetical protein